MTNRTEHSNPAAASPGFTLVELLITLAMAAVLVAVLLPGLAKSRNADRTAVSQHNLRLLGLASIQSAYDNAFAIPAFEPNENTAKQQAVSLISQLTGRGIVTGEPDQLVRLDTITPRRRYQHLLLTDYIGSVLPNPTVASPFDRNQLRWQIDPLFAQENTVPYAGGSVAAGYDRSANWSNLDVRQMWPYASSYQTVPAAWLPDNDTNSWGPTQDTPHLFFVGITQQRFYNEIAFPSGKVHQFEEFDGLWRNRLWFAYPEAKCNLLFFDGSVRRLRSDESNPGWNPRGPNSVWTQRYRPLDTFPWYAHGYSFGVRVPMRYRWTREGLAGIDFGGRDVNVPPEVRADPDYRSEVYPRFANRRPIKAHTGERQLLEP